MRDLHYQFGQSFPSLKHNFNEFVNQLYGFSCCWTNNQREVVIWVLKQPNWYIVTIETQNRLEGQCIENLTIESFIIIKMYFRPEALQYDYHNTLWDTL